MPPTGVDALFTFQGFNGLDQGIRVIERQDASLTFQYKQNGATPRIAFEVSSAPTSSQQSLTLTVYQDLKLRASVTLSPSVERAPVEFGLRETESGEDWETTKITLHVSPTGAERSEHLPATQIPEGISVGTFHIDDAVVIPPCHFSDCEALPPEAWAFINTACAPSAKPPAMFHEPDTFLAAREQDGDEDMEHIVQFSKEAREGGLWALTFVCNPLETDGVRCFLHETGHRDRRVVVDFFMGEEPTAVPRSPQGDGIRLINHGIHPLGNGWFRCHVTANLPVTSVTCSLSTWKAEQLLYRGNPQCGLSLGDVQLHGERSSTIGLPGITTPPLKHHFLLCSQGNAGSIWLARALDLHDGITCSMGNDHPIVSMLDGYPFNGLSDDQLSAVEVEWNGKITRPEDVRLGVKSTETKARQVVRNILDRNCPGAPLPERSLPLRLDSLFSELERFFDTPVYGNIHGMTIDNVAVQLQTATFKRSTVLMNLIRHPVPRFHALFSRTIDLWTPDRTLEPEIENGVRAHHEILEALETRFNVDWSDARNRFVFWAFVGLPSLDGWARELSHFPQFFHIPIEKLMRDPSYFRSTVKLLTHDKIPVDQSFLDAVFSEARQGVGRAHPLQKNKKTSTPEETFAAWPEWVQEMFRDCARRSNYKELYGPYDYDFSFME